MPEIRNKTQVIMELLTNQQAKSYLNVNVSTLTSEKKIVGQTLPSFQPVRTTSGGELITGAINLNSSDVTNILPIANGGSGIGVVPTIATGTSLTLNGSSYPNWSINTVQNLISTSTPSFQTANLLALSTSLPVCTTGLLSTLTARQINLASGDTTGVLPMDQLDIMPGTNISILGDVISVTSSPIFSNITGTLLTVAQPNIVVAESQVTNLVTDLANRQFLVRKMHFSNLTVYVRPVN